MKILDIYILKRYIITFFSLILIFIPIGILVDLSEKVGKILTSEASTNEIIIYYLCFSGYYADLLFPIFLFISIIWFTSKLSNNSEIIAILSSSISFKRFLRPYLLGALIIGLFVFFMQMFIIPAASKGYQDFTHNYLYTSHKVRQTSQIFNQINPNQYVYVSDYKPANQEGYNFTLESFEGEKMDFKIIADKISWNEEDSLYNLINFKKRIIGAENDSLEIKQIKDTILPFKIDELSQESYIAETKNIFELNRFIKKEKSRGSPNINRYLLVNHKRWVMPLTIFILTIIAVSVSSVKRRGGIGLNLSFGMATAFVYVFFDKIFGVLVANSHFSPLYAIIIPNLLFGILAIFLIKKSKK